jgi:hypothetical protein
MEQTSSSHKQLAISYNGLIAIYAIIPICLLVILIDHLFLHHQLRRHLPRNPEEIFFYLIIFDLPHIMASFFTLIDRDYITFYKPQLLIGIPLLAIMAIVLPQIHYTLATLVFVIWAISHFVFQQAGIAAMMMRGRNRKLFFSWQWLAIAIIVIAYISNNYQWIDMGITTQMRNHIILSLIGVYTLLSFFAGHRSSMIKGTIYYWATYLIPVSASLCLIWNYPLFAVFIPRFIHDVTAFVFYSIHDHNRNREKTPNYLYRIFAPFKIPIVWLSPILAIIIAYPLKHNVFFVPSFSLYLFAGFFHYYMDIFEWRRGTIHRQQLIFKE